MNSKILPLSCRWNRRLPSEAIWTEAPLASSSFHPPPGSPLNSKILPVL
jgi:hypothetical protein